ncbi:uncharacterized protein LOC141643475 isoform X2 [Silene latifolia]|uniref:uncharacterized protein LOC141643475 isoform X2 n=1 Tax=Silene latifolia TaxID=37657 RepID=UPI003D77A488
MLQPATVLYIWASLGIVCTLACLAECVSFPLEGVCNLVDNSACCSSIRNSAVGLENSYQCHFALDYRARWQKHFSDSENVCCCSEEFPFHSTLHDSHSKEQCSKEKPDINVGWSSNDFLTHLVDGATLACFLKIRWLDHSTILHSVNNTDPIVLSPGRERLLYKREAGISSLNIEIEKSPSSELSFRCLSISPKKLDWGQNYIYHPSVAFLRLENICNENVIKVFEPFSTDSQFHPFNFSEVLLGPGEFTSIPFVFLPKWLGSSSAELVLQTSLGGFLVQAKGSVIESPDKLVPLLGFNVSSGGWPNRKLSVANPFDEAIHWKEVTAYFSAIGNDNTHLAQVICFKQNPGFNGYSFSDDKKRSNDVIELLDSVVLTIGRLRLLDGERETITVPFEALINNPATWKDIAPPLSAFIDAVGSCSESEITISVSVTNNASDLLKVVQITEVAESKKLLKIKYVKGLLLFPGSVTQVALVTYNTSDVNSESFVNMAHQSLSCKLVILANDSRNPSLEVPCQNLFGICLKQQPVLRNHLPLSTERPSTFTKKWRDQRTMNDLYLLDDHELFFPLVPLDRYSGKSITVKNPSQYSVTVQLILNSGEIVDNCKPHISHIPSPWLNNFVHHDSAGPTRYGFSMVENTVTEAFLHPYGTASLGPIFFRPSNRCEWTSLALIRNNLSGVERLSLRGYGGLLSLVLLEGPELKHELHFNTSLPNPTNVSSPVEPMLKKLIALNAGDFDLKIERIEVSGASCGLDGFLVHNCKGFALGPGESYELDISYQADFSRPVVHRDLEFKFASGMLIVPMQASIPIDILNFCRKSIFWVQVKVCVIAVVLAIAAVLMILLFWFITLQITPSDSPVDYLITCEKRSIPIVRPREKTSTRLKKVQRDKGDLKKAIIVEYADCKTAGSSDATTETSFSASSISKSIEIESGGGKDAPPVSLTVRTRKDKRRRPRKRSGVNSGLMAHIEVSTSQSGNSTPSSPLSPITTPSPKNTCSLSPRESRSDESTSYTSTQSAVSVEVSGNCTDLLYTRRPFCPDSTRSKPVVLPCATFSGTERLCPSRMAISPHARAPGPKVKPQKAVQVVEEKRTDPEGRFTYDIWGNHFPGLHLMGRSDESLDMVSEFTKGHSGSFFLRDPQQTLLANSTPAPVTVSRSAEEG